MYDINIDLQIIEEAVRNRDQIDRELAEAHAAPGACRTRDRKRLKDLRDSEQARIDFALKVATL